MPISKHPSAHTHELPGARFTTLASPARGSTRTSMWLVELAAGHPPTPHQLTAEELFFVIEGEARVRIGNEACSVVTGDCIIVPPATPFSLEAVGAAPFKAVCCLPVGGEARLEGGEAFVPPWAR